jgi:hypothetical protein
VPLPRESSRSTRHSAGAILRSALCSLLALLLALGPVRPVWAAVDAAMRLAYFTGASYRSISKEQP